MSQGAIETAYVEILPKLSADFSGDVLNDVNKALGQVNKSVNKTLNDGLTKASKSGAKALSDNVSQAAEKADTSIKKVANSAKDIGTSVSKGAATASKSLTEVGSSAEKAGNRVTSAFGNVGTRVSTALNGISTTANRVSNTVTSTFTNAGTRISNALDGTKLGKGLDRIGSTASGAFAKLQSAADRAGKGVGDSVEKGAKRAEKAVDDVGRSGGRLSESFKGVGAAVAGAFALDAVIGGVTDVIGRAADLNETLSKTEVLLGKDGLKAAQTFSKGAQEALGQTQQQALDAISTFAIFGKSAGLQGPALTGFSTQLTALASDLASFNNTSVDQAIEAIGAGLRGETEPLRAFGVLMDDASLRAEALSQGLIKTTKEALTPQQKVLASQALILKQTTAAQGDFARTSGGLANQQRILTATVDNLKTRLGSALLPAALAVVKGLNNGLIPAVEKVGRVLGPVFSTIGDGVRDLLAGAQAFGGFSEIGDQAQEIFGNLASTVSNAIGGIVDALGQANFSGLFEAAIPAVQTYYKALLDIGKVISEQVGPIVEGLVGIFATVVVPAFNVVVGFVTGTLLPALTDLYQTVAKNVIPIIRTIGEQIQKNVLPALRSFGQVLSGTVLPVLARVAGIIIAIVKPFLKLAITILGKVIPPILRLVGPVLGFLIKAIGQIIKVVFQFLNALLNIPKGVSSVGKAIGDFGKKVGSAVASAAKAVASFVVNIIQGFGRIPALIKAAAEKIGQAILGILKALPGVLAGIARFILDVVQFFISLPFKIIGAVIVIDLLLFQLFQKAMAKVTQAVQAGAQAVLNFFTALPGRIVAALATVGSAVSTAFNAVVSFFQALPGRLVGFLGTLANGVNNVINRVVGFFLAMGGRIASAIASIPGIISGLVQRIAQFFTNLVSRAITMMASFGRAILNGVNSAVNFFKQLVRNAVSAISSLPGTVANIATRVASSMLNALRSLPANIGNLMAQIPKRIQALGGAMLSAGKNLIQKLFDGLKRIGGGAADIGRSVANAVKGFVNSNVIDRLNSALTFKIGGVTIDPPNIPHLAKGAVLDKATLNIAGEAGREVVLPLTKADRMAKLLADQRVTPAVAKAMQNPKVALAMQKHQMPLAQFQPIRTQQPPRPLPALRAAGARTVGNVTEPRTMGLEEVVAELKKLRKQLKDLEAGNTFNINEVGDAEATAQRIANRLGSTGDRVR